MSKKYVVLVTGMVAAVATGCGDRTLADHDSIYSVSQDRFVWCAESLENKHHHRGVDHDVLGAIERAKLDGSTLHLYAHSPGRTIEVQYLEQVLASAVAAEVVFTAYDELNAHAVPGSLALAFDDDTVDTWSAIRPLLARYHARVTFFISGFLSFTPTQRAQLRQLAEDGHDIEYHSTNHLDARKFVAEHGADAYIATEIRPALDAMRAAGYSPATFAYPGGARSAATDEALRPYFDHLRATMGTCPWGRNRDR